jgi:hypothetical protein
MLTRRSLFAAFWLALPMVGLAASGASATTDDATHRPRTHHAAAAHKAGPRHAAAPRKPGSTHHAAVHRAPRKKAGTGAA